VPLTLSQSQRAIGDQVWGQVVSTRRQLRAFDVKILVKADMATLSPARGLPSWQ